jgi:hypothetical protein
MRTCAGYKLDPCGFPVDATAIYDRNRQHIKET